MTPITREDIDRMKASGYEARTMREAEERLAQLQRGEAVVDKIRAAFAGVTLGNGIGLREARGLDDYEDEETLARFRAEDEKENWELIPAQDLEVFHDTLSFFDADGLRFHLPAFMISELQGEWKFGLDFKLTRLDEHGRSRLTSLDWKQRQAVRAFLIHVLEDPDYLFSRDEIKGALEVFWTADA